MADKKKFVEAVDRNDRKVFIPAHYLDHPTWGYRLRHPKRVKEPGNTHNNEPATAGSETKEVAT